MKKYIIFSIILNLSIPVLFIMYIEKIVSQNPILLGSSISVVLFIQIILMIYSLRNLMFHKKNIASAVLLVVSLISVYFLIYLFSIWWIIWNV